MSETWSSARVAVRRLKAALRDADEDARHKFAYWVIGLCLTAFAIVVEFGWVGVVFCFGVVLLSVSNAP